MLIGAGASVNAANDYGVTPLSLACVNGNPAMVAALLKAGANPNAAGSTGETPLMTAARTGVLAVVEALAASGADVRAKEPGQEQDALMWAISEKHTAGSAGPHRARRGCARAVEGRLYAPALRRACR